MASKDDIRAAHKKRAIIYYHMNNTLSDELGSDRATELMKKAIFKHGSDVAAHYPQAAQDGDVNAIAGQWALPDKAGTEVFGQEAEVIDENSVRLIIRNCPLVEAWREYGISPKKIDCLCDIANAVDVGTFDAMGFNIEFKKRLGAGDDYCEMILKRKK